MSGAGGQQPALYLFDIDGTLMLSGGAGGAALAQAFEVRYGLAGAMDGISPAGRTDPEIVGQMFANTLGRAPSEDEFEALMRVYIPMLHELLQVPGRIELMPAVIDTLDFLSARVAVHLGVATGNAHAGARVKLTCAGLWQRFAIGGYGDDSGERAKLVARAIERAEALIGQRIARERIAVVGDTPRDVSAARACGVRALAVATGSYSHDRLRASEPDTVFATLAELPDWHRAHLER